MRTSYLFALLITLLGAALHLDNPKARAAIEQSTALSFQIRDTKRVLEDLRWTTAASMHLRNMQHDSIQLWKGRYYATLLEFITCQQK